MIGKSSVRIQAVISKEDYKKLEDIAKNEDRSISNLAGRMIRESLSKSKKWFHFVVFKFPEIEKYLF